MTVMRAIHAVPPDPSPTAVSALPDRLTAIRGEGVPDASVVVPVNAQGDLGHVAALLTDLARYRGPRRLEVIVVLNNYAGQEPPHRAQLESWGACLLTIPSVRRSGEAVSFTARIPGARAAASDITIHFDADCRIPDPTTLIDWYVDALGSAGSAYAPVLFHSVPHGRAPELAVAVHHLSRWCKRVLLGIPTLRGSAYAVRRGLLLNAYDRGRLADDMNVGPAIRASGACVMYGSAPGLAVRTSGRMYDFRWTDLLHYFRYRLAYNLRVLPVGDGAAARTGRERDPVRRYLDDRPVR